MIAEEYPDDYGSNDWDQRDYNLEDYGRDGYASPWSTLRSHRWLLEIDDFNMAGLLARRFRFDELTGDVYVEIYSTEAQKGHKAMPLELQKLKKRRKIDMTLTMTGGVHESLLEYHLQKGKLLSMEHDLDYRSTDPTVIGWKFGNS